MDSKLMLLVVQLEIVRAEASMDIATPIKITSNKFITFPIENKIPVNYIKLN
jgi:hypothetical protein